MVLPCQHNHVYTCAYAGRFQKYRDDNKSQAEARIATSPPLQQSQILFLYGAFADSEMKRAHNKT